MHQKKPLDIDEIDNLINGLLVKGDSWYLLDKNWFDKCKEYHKSGDSTSYPGPIDNSALFQSINDQSIAHHEAANDEAAGATTAWPGSWPAADSTTATTTTTTTSNGDTTTNNNSKFKSPTNADAVSVDSRPLRDDLSEAEGHFILVPEKCWNLLKEAFGINGPSHEIRRSVVGVSPGSNFVEIHHVSLKMCLYGGKEATVEKNFSRATTLDELQQEMRKTFNISPDTETKLWINATPYLFKPSQGGSPASGSGSSSGALSPSKSENNLQQQPSTTSPIKPPPTPPPMPSVVTRQAANSMNKPIALPDSSTSPTSTTNKSLTTSTSDSPLSSTSACKEGSPNQTLVDAGVVKSAVVTLEVVNNDGTWPSSKPRYGTVSTRSSKAQPGLCGLSNMGNTCFMNTALQCLSNAPPLTNYILSDKFVEDINPNNPLGMHGEIARTYAELVKVIWSGNHTSFLPREFKCAVSRFAPQFNGFAQQDCQELMAFLLDGLHEDLNRIRNKPYIEIKNDIERRPDEVVADESWANYKKRNDSIVVDTFHAMLKSTLVCPGCKLVSVTFDPFCYLSLPLPVKREKQVNLTFLPAPSSVDESKIKTVSNMLDPEEVKTIKQYGGSIASFNGLAEEHGGYADTASYPRACKMQVPRSGPASEICEIVARIFNEDRLLPDEVRPDNLVVAELSADGRISKVYESNEHYNQISDDIVVVEKKSNYVIPLYLRERKNKNTIAGTVVAKPLFLHVPDLKFETLYKSTIASLSNLTAQSHEEFQIDGKNHDGWFKLVSPTEEEEEVDENSSNNNGVDDPSDQMDCEDEDRSSDLADSTGDCAADKMDTNNDVCGAKTNGNSTNKTTTTTTTSGNAFDLCIVNSFGNHSIETLGPNQKECDYSSKLYLGATFTSTSSAAAFSPQFGHLRLPKYCDSVETFTPKVSPKPTLQLKDCITQFTNIERLGVDDPWYCPKCKKHQQATKKFDIWSLPKVLIIHLKRFSFSRSWRDKIDTLVEFPVNNLDMSKYVLNPNQKKQKMMYDLIGVSNHFGGLGGGHYTAYAKNSIQNAWYSFDDALVTQTSSNSVVTRSAYVLFYQLNEDCSSSPSLSTPPSLSQLVKEEK